MTDEAWQPWILGTFTCSYPNGDKTYTDRIRLFPLGSGVIVSLPDGQARMSIEDMTELGQALIEGARTLRERAEANLT
ncbi:MAG: hypothetical protein J2P43_01255 [Candidatus Dormibacteraeota bacterium]|nr:hypothetical protein [Candidatus Dormibacteraeota bacterium]